jgi:hypothetical protein
VERDLGLVAAESAAQEPQPLHRIDAVHRLLQLQVGVVPVEEDDGLVDDSPPLIGAELVDAGEVQAQAASALQDSADAVVLRMRGERIQGR